jgi:hypothetical protein
MDSNLAIKPGSEVVYGERRFVIMQVISFEAVVARDVETDELERLAIADLRPVSSPEPSVASSTGWIRSKRRRACSNRDHQAHSGRAVAPRLRPGD